MQAQMHNVGCPILGEMAQAYWQVERELVNEQREVIVPKGTLEIIFNLGTRAELGAEINQQTISLPRCFLSGYHTGPIRMRIPSEQRFFGVNLHSAAVQKIFKLGAAAFINQCLDLTLVDKSIGRLWHQLGEAQTFSERMQLASQWLLDRMPDLAPRERLLDRFLYNHLSSRTSVSALAGELCYSTRQLSRKLITLTGMNTEQVLLYKKYLHSLALIHHSSESLVSITYNSGFSDQSHFIKTFKSYTGMLPGEYRNIRSHVTGHIFEDVR